MGKVDLKPPPIPSTPASELDGKETRSKKAATDPYIIYHDDYRRGKSCADVLY